MRRLALDLIPGGRHPAFAIFQQGVYVTRTLAILKVTELRQARA